MQPREVVDLLVSDSCAGQASFVLLCLADERELPYHFGPNSVLYVWKHGQLEADNTLPPLIPGTFPGGFDAAAYP